MMKSILLIALFSVYCFARSDIDLDLPQEDIIPIPITADLVNVSNWVRDPTAIVGGTIVAAASDYPWTVAYLRTATSLKCGGSIISENWIVTAAHCISGSSPTGERISAGNLRYNDANFQYTISEVYVHPNYDASTIDYDVALLYISTPIEFSNTVNAIRIAPASSGPFNGVTSTILGWGTTSEGGSISAVLREVDIPIITNAQCSNYYSGNNGITARMLCAYVTGGGKDSCQGDSGGPLVINNNGEYLLAGIVSWGIGCARNNYPGVYTRVSSVHSWICSTSGVC